MNAYRNYKKNQGLAKARAILDDNMDNFIEHMDLLILYALHKEFGFGAVRLERFFMCISDYYEAFRRQFVKPGDDNRFWQKGGRMDTYALKYYLKEIGFDYDAVCEKKLKENDEKKEENRQ